MPVFDIYTFVAITSMLVACKSNCLQTLVCIVLCYWTHCSILPNSFHIDINLWLTEAMGHADGEAVNNKLILFGQARPGVFLKGSQNTYCTLSASQIVWNAACLSVPWFYKWNIYL
jgi:hypothetical protein